MTAHARLGPSNHRWPHCPGSVREEAVYPDVAGEAAIDGTGSHLLLELCLINSTRADAYLGQIIGVNHFEKPNGWIVHRDRCERVQMCLDYVERRVKELKEQYSKYAVIVEAESKSNPGKYFERDDWWGTVDITITVYHTNGHGLYYEVVDFKDGRGWVRHEDNTQLVSYLGGKILQGCVYREDVPVRMTIVQPKTNVPIRYQDSTAKEVYVQLRELAVAASATDAPDAPLKPDSKQGKDYCQWCKHRNNCAPLAESKLRGISVITNVSNNGTPLFQQLQDAAVNVETMSIDSLARLADTRAAVEVIYDKIEVRIKQLIEDGNHVPGYAIGPGRGSKVWNFGPEEIEKKLKTLKLKKEQIFTTSLVSPVQCLKIEGLTKEQKEKIENELISVKAGADTLKRVAVVEKPSIEKMFSEIALQSQTNVVHSESPINFL